MIWYDDKILPKKYDALEKKLFVLNIKGGNAANRKPIVAPTNLQVDDRISRL